VGCGRGSAYGHLISHHPACEIAAISDWDPEALARHQQELRLPDDRCFTEYRELVASRPALDAVVIGTPIPAHAEQVVLALEAGIHVMSEVTAAHTVEGCRRIVAAVRASGCFYMLAENTIYRPLFREWEKLVWEGCLGEVIYAEADYLHPIPSLLVNRETGERYWRAHRPPVHYCSHSLGPLLHLMKDRVVRAMGVGQGERILPGVGVGAVDIQLAVFETARGAIIKMTRSQVAPRHPPVHYYHLQGTRGFVETDRRGAGFTGQGQRGLLYIAGKMEQAEEVEWPEIDPSVPEWATVGGHGTSDYGTFVAFLQALESGQKPGLDEIWAWNLTVPGLVAAESVAQGGEWREVPPPPGSDEGNDGCTREGEDR
jgi:predicted dehydrogenase